MIEISKLLNLNLKINQIKYNIYEIYKKDYERQIK
jgi:hypothetical protein